MPLREPRKRESLRTCIGCGAVEPKGSLIRVVSSRCAQNATLTIDSRQRAAGRGAYLHPRLSCFERAVKRGAFSRSLRLGERGREGLAELRAVFVELLAGPG